MRQSLPVRIVSSRWAQWAARVPHPGRAQPANVLLRGNDAYMFDVGDGAAGQLARTGVPVSRVQAIFISHFHFDHTGGLAALLGLRYQLDAPGVVTIYGPPGIKQLVDGILAFMEPGAAIGTGVSGVTHTPPSEKVRTIEMVDGSKISMGDLTITAAENSHYSFAPGSVEAERYKSLSFRMDMPGKSVVYTGDTGPSTAVEKLARNADMLVSEMIDVDMALDTVRRSNPQIPEARFKIMQEHLSTHHLTPEMVGQMAARANVRHVVVTHVAPGSTDDADLTRYRAGIRRNFRGDITIANDLDHF